jgi:hypothetical protein
MWHSVAAAALAVLVTVHLVLRWRRAQRKRAGAAEHFYAAVRGMFEAARLEDTGAVGLPRLCGRFAQYHVQVQPVVDTLALRRLPVLWLLVTLQDALPLRARLDLMMRSAGPTTFSNFDLLPVTLPTPAGFPDHAMLRTDDRAHVIATEVLRPHVGLFADPRAKELLLTPNGVRIVWMLAEADRARYGVFRQADFGDVSLQPELLRALLARLIAVRTSILERAG